jgi:hypothetical protein
MELSSTGFRQRPLRTVRIHNPTPTLVAVLPEAIPQPKSGRCELTASRLRAPDTTQCSGANDNLEPVSPAFDNKALRLNAVASPKTKATAYSRPGG